MFQTLTSVWPITIALSGLVSVGLACYWLFNKQAKKRNLEELRRNYKEMSPTDPEYNTAKALFIAAMISDTATSHYSGSNSNSDANTSSGDAGGSGD